MFDGYVIWKKLSVQIEVDTINPERNKFTMGVRIKATSELKKAVDNHCNTVLSVRLSSHRSSGGYSLANR